MYSAVILAGGESPWLKEVAGTPYRAWAPLKGKPMALYIAEALLQSRKVDKVLIVGPKIAVPCSLPKNVEVIEAGDTLMATVTLALGYLGTKHPVIFTTDDIPCLTAAAVADFVEQAEVLQAQVCYTVIPRAAVEKAFPAAKRTYAKIKEGKFTGGNIFLVEPAVVPQCREQVEAVFAKRKDIFSLCKWLGWSFIFKYIIGVLTLTQVEKRASTLFGFKGRAVITNYATIGMDVDKLADWRLAEKFLAEVEKGERKIDG